MCFNLLFLHCLLNFVWKLIIIIWSVHEIMIKIQLLYLIMKFLKCLKRFMMIHYFHNLLFYNYILLFSDNSSFSDDVYNLTWIELWIFLLINMSWDLEHYSFKKSSDLLMSVLNIVNIFDCFNKIIWLYFHYEFYYFFDKIIILAETWSI